MKKEAIIVVVDDDRGHAGLIRKNLARAGIANEVIHFYDGQSVLDFFFRRGEGEHMQPDGAYIVLLDIRMPGIDGTEVLRKLKADNDLKKIPVIMITTTDDPREVDLCHSLGCSNYITKPVEYDAFVNAIRQLGLFLAVVQVPNVNKQEEE